MSGGERMGDHLTLEKAMHMLHDLKGKMSEGNRILLMSYLNGLHDYQQEALKAREQISTLQQQLVAPESVATCRAVIEKLDQTSCEIDTLPISSSDIDATKECIKDAKRRLAFASVPAASRELLEQYANLDDILDDDTSSDDWDDWY